MTDALFAPLELPNGVILKNRIAKSAMSDSLGDGRGAPTSAQMRLYERWAEGGVALSMIGEVQVDAGYPEKPGNLVLDPSADLSGFAELARRGTAGGAQLWPQLGHAGAMAYPPINAPKGPSALDLPGLSCGALTLGEVQALPAAYATTARLAEKAGFGGVEIHAAHGFLLSQFLSPLFNKRSDAYGGPLTNRMRLLIEVIEAVRAAVSPGFAIGVKLNATDQLEGGFAEAEALEVIAALDGTATDLIDISGGTYFPGAKSSSDRVGGGAYFVDFARAARSKTTKPLMVTGGFKTKAEAMAAVSAGDADMVGLARSLVLDPALPNQWKMGVAAPSFPRFVTPPEGGITAWYTMRITDLAHDQESDAAPDLPAAVAAYDTRDAERVPLWNAAFSRR